MEVMCDAAKAEYKAGQFRQPITKNAHPTDFNILNKIFLN